MYSELVSWNIDGLKIFAGNPSANFTIKCTASDGAGIILHRIIECTTRDNGIIYQILAKDTAGNRTAGDSHTGINPPYQRKRSTGSWNRADGKLRC